ncbi:hypothetical protein LCGC14_3041680, partial [marine sediment metagenome]
LIEARMYNSRTLVCVGEIEEYGAGQLANQFQTLAEEPEEITLLITSYGGAVDAGGAILRAVRYAQHKGCTVIGEVRGYAMSMAAIVLQQCDLRFATPEDIVMVHGFTGASVGDVRNTAEDLRVTRKLTQIYSKFFADRSTADDEKYHDKKYWKKLLEDSLPHNYFGEEALKVGLIDEVLP